MRRRPARALTLTLTLALMAGIRGSAEPLDPPDLVGRVRWQEAIEGFGGFSAIELWPDGTRFVALTDQGLVLAGRLDRDGAGQLTGARLDDRISPRHLTLGPSGKRADSEGLALAPDGRLFLSFEGPARLHELGAPPLARAGGRDLPEALQDLPRNAGLEALAMDADGALYTLPERSRQDSFPLYRWQAGSWTLAARLPRRGGYSAVALDFGPDGLLYLLERNTSGFGGFSTRLRRFDLGAGAADLTEAELLRTPYGLHQNLEGLSVWRAPDGGLRATMISDDNFTFLFTTELVEYRLPD